MVMEYSEIRIIPMIFIQKLEYFRIDFLIIEWYSIYINMEGVKYID